MAFTFTLNGNIYSSDPASGALDGYRFIGYGYITALANLVQDIVSVMTQQVANASTQAQSAADSAASAANAPGTNATSATNMTVAMGNQVFTMTAGKAYSKGQQVIVSSTASPINWMAGTLTDYNPVTGATNAIVTNISGVGTFSSWSISLSGAPAVTGVLNELKGVSIASAATISLTTATGNFVHVTGSGQSISIITIPVGAERTIVFDGVNTLVHGAGLLLPGAVNIATDVNDRMTVRGDSAGAIVTSYTRTNGLPLSFYPPVRAIKQLTSSGTYIAPADGLLRMTLVGACGSGGAAVDVAANAAVASGAGAGGICIKTIPVKLGDTFTVTLAAGGAQNQNVTSGTAQNGNPGGNSTITGPNTNMIANGGSGGKAARGATAVSVTGGTGGVASGGDFNVTGGTAGTATANSLTCTSATGGAAVGWNGVGYSSGSATSSGVNMAAASGGAGVGGISGSVVSSTARSASNGGGSNAESQAATNTVPASIATGMTSAVSSLPLNLVGGGGAAKDQIAGSSGGDGGGGGGACGGSAATASSGGGGGLLAGSGGVAVSGASSLSVSSSTGGGPSGGVAITGATVTAIARAGSSAFATFEWTEL